MVHYGSVMMKYNIAITLLIMRACISQLARLLMVATLLLAR
jgi:hypothetical protein